MRYWQKKIQSDPLYRAVAQFGFDEAVKQLGTTRKKLEDQLSILRYRYDTERFAADQLVITTKLGHLKRLKYNKGQKMIQDAIERQRLAGKPIRIALLKARQFGGSTEFEAEIFKDTILRKYRRSMIIAHELDSARHLRDMSERYYDHYSLPKPEKRTASDKWWKFKHDVEGVAADSSVLIDTADDLSAGHSQTLHNLHCSEIQAWRNAQELVKGLFPTVPEDPDTMIFMEGTGCGIGNWWYEFIQTALDPDSKWEFVFVPWYDVEDYTVPHISEAEAEAIVNTADEFEVELLQKGVTPAQLKWRRTKIKDDYNGILEDFQSQYPATPDEAFQTSGRPVFMVKNVVKGRSEAVLPEYTGDLVFTREKNVIFQPNPHGLWDFWEMPKIDAENLYVCGADPAEGIAVIPELGNRGGDFSVAKILRRDTMTFTARCRGRIDPDLFAEELYKASIFYRRLPLMIENNPGGSGNVVVRDLKKREGVYLLKRINLRKRGDDKMDEFGWRTMKDTKRELIDELIQRVRDMDFTDKSINFWMEASTYLRDEKGLTNAQPRKWDDEVIASGLTFQGHLMLPAVYKPRVEPKKYIPRDADVPENWGRQNPHGDTISQRQLMEKTYAS